MAQGYGYQAYGVSSSSCEQLPPDPCWNDDSEDCRQRAQAREEHNQGVREREHRDNVAAAVVGIAVGAVIIVGLAASH
jgi:hypothetical protein